MPATKIISLGGSVIMPDNINIEFLNSFKDLVLDYTKKGNKFVIYCGGGKLARDYQSIVKKLSNANENNLDWIGIYATRLNAYLLKSIFDENANDEIIINPNKKIDFKKPISIAAGWKPGRSTDYDAVLVAKQLRVDTIINVTNVDYVYDKDPKKFKDAKPIKKISWKEFRKLFTEKWSPGLNVPFDPVASREAERNKIKLIVVGSDIGNLKKVLDEERFEGSVVC